MIAGLLVTVAITVMLFFGYKGISSVFEQKGSLQSRTNSADAVKKTDIAQITRGLEHFAFGHSGEYPGYLQALVPDQLSTIPQDPNGASYAYVVSADRKFASVYAVLETKKIYCWRSKDMVPREVDSINFCQP